MNYPYGLQFVHSCSPSTEVLRSPAKLQSNTLEVDAEHESFKGSLEDLVMITNFKRFKRKGSSSRYKGVFYVKKEKKFRAQICLKGKKKYVGTFKNDHDAALARDKKIREMFGEVSELLNFPVSKQECGETTESVEIHEMLNDTDDKIHSANQMKINFTDSSSFENMRNRLSTLSRYGSSGSTLLGFSTAVTNLTNFGGRIENTISPALMERADASAHLGALATSQFNPYQNANSELNQGLSGSAGYNYKAMNMNVFNFQEVSIPKSKAILTKRFSSNDSCFSLFPGCHDFGALGGYFKNNSHCIPSAYQMEDATTTLNMKDHSIGIADKKTKK